MSDETTSEFSPKPVRVIGCGAIAREILAVCEAGGLSHIDLTCLPAIWHNRPEKIAPGLRQAIEEARNEGFERIFIAYAECGSQGEIDRVCREEGIERIPGPHCFSFFSGNAIFADREDDVTSFFLTDFLARQFDAFVTEPLGLDRHPELKDLYFGNYRKLVYVAQTEDAALQRRARDAADFLGLEYEYRFTGYGDLTHTLQSV
jgi:hypothetical protein